MKKDQAKKRKPRSGGPRRLSKTEQAPDPEYGLCCPVCGFASRVYLKKDRIHAVNRRRRCVNPDCDYQFTTMETVVVHGSVSEMRLIELIRDLRANPMIAEQFVVEIGRITRRIQERAMGKGGNDGR